MAAFVSLSALSWSTPEGTTLFSDLTLGFGPERTGLVGRNGAGKSTLLRLICGEIPPASGLVRVSGTVAMMRQEAYDRFAQPDQTLADLFGARSKLAVLARAEAGLADMAELAEADWTFPARMQAALLRCGLSAEADTPLETLSGGQRNRAVLASLICDQPDFLLLDEPTNNLDQEGRRAVIDLVRSWTQGAIIVSHDRELLDGMDAIVELTSLGAARYGGNYSAFRHRKDTERAAAERDLADAQKASKDAAVRAQQARERKARKDGAGHRSRAKGGQPKILLDAAKERAEASRGAAVRLRDARRETADKALSQAREKIEIFQPLLMELPPTGLAASKVVMRLDGLCGGYDPAHPIVTDLSFTLTGPERVTINGINGSGKTTLLRLITGQLRPFGGEATVSVPYALLDQHVGNLAATATVLESFRHLNPAATVQDAHAALARFGFRAQQALRRVQDLSGGERVRAGLACALGGTPPAQMLILDEPTNHLDLDGLDALEAALKAYDGAVLVISHDHAFLKALGPARQIQLGEHRGHSGRP